jgi:hypothetical protein
MNDEDRIRQELERVANSRPKSGRAVQAKVTALRTLERLNRPPQDQGIADPEQVARLFDETRDPNATVEDDDWYPETGDPEGDATMKELDSWSTVAQRRRLYLNLAEDASL